MSNKEFFYNSQTDFEKESIKSFGEDDSNIIEAPWNERTRHDTKLCGDIEDAACYKIEAFKDNYPLLYNTFAEYLFDKYNVASEDLEFMVYIMNAGMIYGTAYGSKITAEKFIKGLGENN